jgi:hypothetical protein
MKLKKVEGVEKKDDIKSDIKEDKETMDKVVD